MTQRTDGGPAFPTPRYERGDMYSLGMTMRDFFAAKAMQIMLDAYDKGYCGLNSQDAPNTDVIARGAYEMADSMLKARES
jgi:hypothetical protein